jgi:hypothetical protein
MIYNGYVRVCMCMHVWALNIDKNVKNEMLLASEGFRY